MGVSHDHGLDLINDYVVNSSPFKSSKILAKILWEVASHLNLDHDHGKYPYHIFIYLDRVSEMWFLRSRINQKGAMVDF